MTDDSRNKREEFERTSRPCCDQCTGHLNVVSLMKELDCMRSCRTSQSYDLKKRDRNLDRGKEEEPLQTKVV